jgi:hypothetical protein
MVTDIGTFVPALAEFVLDEGGDAVAPDREGEA